MKLRSSTATTSSKRRRCVFWPSDLASSLRARREEEEQRFLLLGWSLGGCNGESLGESLAVVSALKCTESRRELSKARVVEINEIVEAKHQQALSRVHPPEASSSSSSLKWNKLCVIGTALCSRERERVEVDLGVWGGGGSLETLVQHQVGDEFTFQSADSAAQVITYSYDRSQLFSRICPDVDLEGPSTNEEEVGLRCLERISRAADGLVRGNSRRPFSLAHCICSLNETCFYRPVAADVEQIWNGDALTRLSKCIYRAPKASVDRGIQAVGSYYFPMFLWSSFRGGSRAQAEEANPITITLGSLHLDYLKRADRRMAFVAGRMLGLLLSVWVLNHRDLLQNGILSCLETFKKDVVLRAVAVLEGSPGGLKLYEDLSHFFGFTTRFLVGAVFSNREMLALVVEHSLTLVSILSGTFGLQTGLSSVADLLLMLALPYSLLYYIYSLVFRCHLRLSREMHLLFRGRWRLREEDRLSSKTFFLEHVIVGILLLTPLLFLMPTVFVYYLFWALVFFALKIILLQIQMLMVVTELFPLASVWLRYWKPGLFRKSIYLEYEDNAGSLPSSHAAVALTVAFSHEGFLQLALGNAGQIFSVLLSEILSDLKRILLGETLPFLKLVK